MKLVWTRRATADLRRICERIAEDKPLAAEDFALGLQEKLAHLQRFPLLGRTGAYEDTRELVVHKNYLVTYRLRADEIQLLQLWHVARHR